MKKLKSFKKMSAKATAMLLCLATSATCMTLAVPYLTAPHAVEGDVTISGEQVQIANGVNVVDSCDYGKTFPVPAGAVVTAPNGEDATPASNEEVKADQIGNYKVSFVSDDLNYDFFVKVRLDEEFFLKVDYNGADIPSYVASNGKFTLPGATVCYYDDNNILQEYPGNYTVTARNSFDTTKYTFGDNASNEFTAPATTGKVFITYDAQLDNGSKWFSKTYTVNVQSTVQSSTSNPTLSVSGVQRDVSVNRAVTLPKATATDSYDDNVKVEVTVTDPHGEPVKYVDIDENGYARVKEGAKAVVFDNDQAMTFYPTETGSYKVTYTAHNDNGGKSSTREYYITVSDLVAPIFKNVEEWRIPETWGMNVVAGDDDVAKDATVVAEGGKLTFTVPDVVDNKDHMPANADDKDDVISMYFRITDSDNSKTIVEFTNILAADTSDDCKFKYNSTYEKKDDTADSVTFNKNTPFTFDFTKYNKTNSKGENQDKPGTYTVLYRARDKANNTSSRTFTVNLQETYTDKAAPTTAEVTVPDYISAADSTFTVPQASVVDAADTRIKKVYKIYNNAEGDAAKGIDVEGGEVADIEEVGGERTLIINKGKANEKTLPLTDKLYFYVSATDKLGNFKSNANNTTDYKLSDAQITVIPATQASSIVYAGSGMQTVTGTKKAGETVSFGGFTVTNAKDMRNYTGFEVAAFDPKGNALNVTLETMSTVNGDTAKIYVQNISFNLPVATANGEFYSVIVRVFDVNGNNNIYGYKLGNVEKSDNTSVGTQAISTIGTSGDVSTTYKLHNEVIKGITGSPDDVYRVVRKISGGVFALMGSEFTAKTQGSYTVYDGYILENTDNVSANSFEYGAVTPAGGNNGVYNFNVTDTAAPIIEVQGTMPSYQAFGKNESGVEVKSVNIDLPDIVAYTENGEAEVKIEVTGPNNNNDVKVETYEDGDKQGQKYFTATADGAYTVNVTATYANASPATAKYTVNVGDVQGPEFKLVNDSTTTAVGGTYTVGATFKFAKMELLEDESGVEITKTLVDPSNENVSDATISGSYSNNKDRLDNSTDITFSMAGKYKVVYTAKDTYGNETKQEFEITVVSSGSSTPTTWTTLSTVLIIVAIVLLAGVIVYVVRFRKVKK